MSKYGIEVRARTRRLDLKEGIRPLVTKQELEGRIREFCYDTDLTFIEDTLSYDSFMVEYKPTNDKLLPDKVLEARMDKLFNIISLLGYELRD
ncbi:hypothetical protein [Burkholderia pseudomallei]|jgi:hypothetical protein|uniref:hypothetical protein n=1 Tax=Burkholderia pseudomallei TaxID=28450 RepID=UPI0024E017B4|nr:hypothetical protein [Burkholderia pseudomallei]